MSNEQFAAHGRVNASFDKEHNILYVNLSGPFNLEFMAKYEKEMSAIRQTINSPCWSSLVNVFGLALAPMQALENARQTVENAINKGLVATAVVFHDPDGSSTQKQFWSMMYAKTDVNFRFFDDPEQAKRWLQTEVEKCFANLAQEPHSADANKPPTHH